MPNRRRHTRQNAAELSIIEASISHDRHTYYPAKLTLCNISRGGLAIECQERFTPGDIVQLKLRTEGGTDMELSTTISNRTPMSPSGNYRYGLYINTSPHQQQGNGADTYIDTLFPDLRKA